jgi:hypothetical protein
LGAAAVAKLKKNMKNSTFGAAGFEQCQRGPFPAALHSVRSWNILLPQLAGPDG